MLGDFTKAAQENNVVFHGLSFITHLPAQKTIREHSNQSVGKRYGGARGIRTLGTGKARTTV
jgi:hypothetical protein